MKLPGITSIRTFSVQQALRRIRNSRRIRHVLIFLQRKPFTSFLLTLLLLFFTILAGSIISSLSQKEEKKQPVIKTVSVLKIGSTPRVTLQAKIEKKGIIKIVALSPGVVSRIHVTEGTTVKTGEQLFSLSSNYQDGNQQSLQRQLAQVQLNNVNQSYSIQKDLIAKQRNVAEETGTNADRLRDITNQSLGDTRSLIGLNEQIVASLSANLSQLEQTNVQDANSQLILQTRQAISGVQTGLTQLRSGLRSAEYQVNIDNSPTRLAELQKEISLKQLDLQEKSLSLGRETSRLQYNLALVNESLMYPSAPFEAIVERIHVDVGQVVNPSTILATIQCVNVKTTAVLTTPREIATAISRVEATRFKINDQLIAVMPRYISTTATDGQLYAIFYDLPDSVVQNVTNSEYIPAEVPIGAPATGAINPFLPLESVFQTQEKAFVYIVSNKKAQARTVTLGNIFGKYVEIKQGLKKGDNVIATRNVVTGDRIKIEQ